MAPPKKLVDPEWIGAAYARYTAGKAPLRQLAAEPECPVGHQRLSTLFRKIAAEAAATKAAHRAAVKAQDASKPETLVATPPEGQRVVPHGTGGIGAWWGPAPELEGSSLFPDAHYVRGAELVEDRLGRRDLTDRIRARTNPPAQPRRRRSRRKRIDPT